MLDEPVQQCDAQNATQLVQPTAYHVHYYTGPIYTGYFKKNYPISNNYI
jgi:hypothetical protein